jgi:hypothetical protein
MRTALFVLMMLAFAVPANAQMTSAMLARLCSQEGKPGRAMCETYIAGLAEGMLAQKTLLCDTVFDCGPAIEKEGTFCLPEHTVTFEQMAEIWQCTMEVWKLSPCWSNLSLSSPFATPTEKGTSWTSILISIKLNNSVTIPTAMSMARSARTISGLIVVYTIKCIVMLANRFGSLPKEPSSTI